MESLSGTYFYSNTLPVVNEIVMATVRSYDEKIGFSMTLDEYNNHDGLLPLCNLSRKGTWKQIKSLAVGTKHIVIVANVDLVKSTVDLSLMDLSPSEAEEFAKYYTITTHFHNCLKRLSHLAGKSSEDLYCNIVWNNYNKNYQEPENHIGTILALRDNIAELELDDEYRDLLTKYHMQVFGAHTVKAVQKLKMVSFDPYGSKKIAEAFKAARDVFHTDVAHTNEEMYLDQLLHCVEFRPIAPPVYEVVITSCNIAKAQETATQIATFIADKIRANGFAVLVDEKSD